MALEIISREYAAGEAGYRAFCEDLQSMISWSNVKSETGLTTYMMANNDDCTSWAGLRAYQQSSSQPTLDPLSNNGTQTYKVAVLPTSFYFRYVNFVKWDNGFCAHATKTSAMPCTNADFVNFGIVKGSMDGTEKWCSWGMSTGKIFVGSEDTTTASAGGYSPVYAGKLTAATPPVFPHSRYIIDSVLKIDMVQDTYLNTAGYCAWNGRRYYKNGCVLIPADL